uniref:Uncharacterized protein n=1 Tax=Anguilla anguilla TaxID=7936 RepID=A0A0E9V445_ANGAN
MARSEVRHGDEKRHRVVLSSVGPVSNFQIVTSHS